MRVQVQGPYRRNPAHPINPPQYETIRTHMERNKTEAVHKQIHERTDPYRRRHYKHVVLPRCRRTDLIPDPKKNCVMQCSKPSVFPFYWLVKHRITILGYQHLQQSKGSKITIQINQNQTTINISVAYHHISSYFWLLKPCICITYIKIKNIPT